MLRIHTTFAAALILLAVPASAAIVSYSISGSGGGMTATGSVSWDNTVIGANYNSVLAESDITSFSLTITSIPNTPTTTSFTKGVNTASFFQITTDGSGAPTVFSPGYNSNGSYRLFALGGLTSQLRTQPADVAVGSLTFSLTQVPEFGSSALWVAAGLGTFAFLRSRPAKARE